MTLSASILKKSSQIEDEFDYKSLIFKVILSGKIDKAGSIGFWLFLKTLIDGGSLKIVLDLSKLDILDSKGIGKIISLVKLIRSKSGELVLINESQFIREMFISLNMQEFIKVYTNEKEALTYLLTIQLSNE